MLIKNNNPYNINKDIDNPNLIFWYKYKYWKKIGLHTHTHIYIVGSQSVAQAQKI